jgi:hypothetical protein
MFTLAAIEYLQSPNGAEHLRSAAALDLRGPALLRELSRLRKTLSAEQASAVLEQTALRRRAADKFTHAAAMLFTAEGLEQSSGELLADHAARRYRHVHRVADMCCGIGGDTLALATQSLVDAVDIDPIRLACAAHNARATGLDSRITFHLGDVEQIEAEVLRDWGIEAIFFDPSRRSGGRRIFSLDAYHPRVGIVDGWLPKVPALGIKVAPGVEREEVRWQCEQEFVALGSDLKEAMLWFGPFAKTSRRATVLPSGVSLANGQTESQPVEAPSAWLYDPSPAVTRAGLVGELAQLLGAHQLDERLAYLSGSNHVETQLAKAYEIESWQPFGLKRLQAHLRSLNAGRVEVHRRGAPIDPSDLERRLRLEGTEFRLVFVTRLRGKLIAIICRPPA